VLLLKEAVYHARTYESTHVIANGENPEDRTLTLSEKNQADLETAHSLHQQAVNCFKKALALTPDEEQVLIRSASIEIADGLYGEAEIKLHHLLQLPLKKKNIKAHILLSKIYLKRNELPKAKNVLRAALDVEPLLSEAFSSLGEILRREGHNEDAVANFQKGLSINTTCIDSLVGLAETLEALGSIEEATKYYERASKVPEGSRNLKLLNNLADTLALEGKIQDAISNYKKVITLDPKGNSGIDSYLGLGLAYWHDNDFIKV
jgi:tetratricopeptide (TPR) repeat protein